MNFQLTIRLTLLSLFSLGLAACPGMGKGSKANSGASVKRIKGDPDIFVKDTAMNGPRALPAGISEASASWQFDISGFEEESANVDVAAVIKEQTPGEAKQTSFAYPLQSQTDGSRWTLDGIYSGQPARFIFLRSANGWVIERFRLKGQEIIVAQSAAKVIHTSVRPDLSAFTILVQDKTPGRRYLHGLTFLRAKPARERMGNTVYEYFFGKGVKVAWSRKTSRTLLICGEVSPILTNIVQNQVAEWSRVLAGRLQFRTQSRAKCPPYSDLNTQTLVFTSGWIEIAGDGGVPAQTMILSGEGREELLDGDVLFNMDEYQEAFDKMGLKMSVLGPEALNRPGLRKEIGMTTLHEIGHFLGLHHKFDANYPSIMSYDEKREPSLTDYDIKAIQALYSE